MAMHLGHIDKGNIPSNIKNWLSPFHTHMVKRYIPNKSSHFRGERNNQWFPISETPGHQVKALQKFLKEAGFFPNASLSGIFGYGTRSAVRLFQEYVRNVEGEKSIGVPDGVIGGMTQSHIDRWKRDQLVCNWNKYSLDKPSERYLKWFEVLQKARLHYRSKDNPVIENLRNYPVSKSAKSYPPEKWLLRPYDTHLIGIRRNPEVAFENRPNDDLFILLIRGMVFLFWGSTDPNPRLVDHPEGAPFLTEGQHKYRFGWHKVSSQSQVYMALKPYPKGVLVFRDRNKRNMLLPEDIQRGFGEPNDSINIHWTPDGFRNWSAGCQVIKGESYISPENQLISCSEYCASGYNSLSSRKTRGAYNLLTDLVICYSPIEIETVWYTLGRKENFAEIGQEFGNNFIEDELQRLMSV